MAAMTSRATTTRALLALLLATCEREPREAPDDTSPESIVKSDEEWKRELTPEQYRIARQRGTEPAFSGKYWNEKTPGTYVCVCCGQELFSSKAKYDSGSGWPSFTKPIDASNVATERDTSLGMVREEVLCGRCNAHLGHLFEDGPQPTGLRYCVNSGSLELEKKKED